MADPRFFQMTSRWRVPYPRDAVFAVLADADGYARWWPQVREATRTDAQSGTARLRSLAPMSLRISVVEQIRDPVGGELRASVSGDLVGWSSWHISDDDPGATTIVDFAQEVVLRKNIPEWMITTGRPLLYLNHRYMMWAGRRGLLHALLDRRILPAEES